jgi:hypothetical protein
VVASQAETESTQRPSSRGLAVHLAAVREIVAAKSQASL